ncbi:protein-glutamate O-methyltransferase CheR [Methylomonas sp. LL1]|uniref:CheR family methyltransferase n=1 Tax=Methylomonas sp. LL1 TaxID=2785785 RepID=UPI0018C3A7A7|nr:protein-glutamate O-methyltransferase CheR [Methylomonas sp. LL1]QPK64248.1 protein-glutamate O-methyltransferase CheR [Methylomonas sp. LL1]
MQQPIQTEGFSGTYSVPKLYDHEFDLLSKLLFRIAGITMSSVKKPLVTSRLMKRLRHYNLSSFAEYYRMITASEGKAELQMAIDLLTTNETHFFREPKHFDFVRQQILPARRKGQLLRVWSAACSSGEEPYTLAMLLDDSLGLEPWEISASDISTRVLERARGGIYPAERIAEIPKQYLYRYCLKGTGSQTGLLLMEKKLRDRIHFFQHNLMGAPPTLSQFDVIFLRNVLIYFSRDTKRQVVSSLLPALRGGGYFFISHSETLNDLGLALESVAPSIYRKPGP